MSYRGGGGRGGRGGGFGGRGAGESSGRGGYSPSQVGGYGRGSNQTQHWGSRGGRGGRGRGRGRGPNPDWVEDLTRAGELRGHGGAVRAFGFVTEGVGIGLYSGSADASVRVWDVAKGLCTSNVPFGGDVTALLIAGGWLFIGTPGSISCVHMGGAFEQHELPGHTGAVQALCAALERGMIISAGQDRTVRAWVFNPEAGRFAAAGTLVGHEGIVSCLLVAGKLLFSGSLDGTVRVWDLDTAACVFVAPAHEGGVMCMLLWENHLVTAGLDGRIRVWAGVGGPLENKFTHPDDANKEEANGALTAGVFMPAGRTGAAGGRGGGRGGGAAPRLPKALAMCGTVNAEGEPILVVSYDDSSMRFFALPSFEERGRMTQRCCVRALAASAGGFLSGDEKGLIRAWAWGGAGAKT